MQDRITHRLTRLFAQGQSFCSRLARIILRALNIYLSFPVIPAHFKGAVSVCHFLKIILISAHFSSHDTTWKTAVRLMPLVQMVRNAPLRVLAVFALAILASTGKSHSFFSGKYVLS